MKMPKSKYGFNELEIGEHKYYAKCDHSGKALRTAASMYGTRYGVWLTVAEAGLGWKVTRLSSPPTQHSRPKPPEQRDSVTLREIHTAIGALTQLVLQIKRKLEE